ncbi:hypothetical protein OPKNFCMD_0193 [Methylobacterium crusticola]|uniref:O-antigen ligase domain-containing protein n=1 Tax=Methylobacterium crusticola TaxID=1697972 RepID=A0ABQ4QRR9_9HYPH|nr:VpsF family polysaccharide biosynthesis protein [Methylobacterium crusticola]GJD47485.1 hypothetical protein OPKNFCMD_0193 [Methylobacterium crusticola]
MSSLDRTIEGQPDGRATPLYSALFLSFAGLILARIAVNSRLLDLVMSYTSEGGSIVEKIHPTFWGLLAVGVVVLLNFRIVLTEWELRVVRALMAFCATAAGLLVFASVTGHSSSVGYLLDSYVTHIALVLLFAFPQAWRRGLGHALLGYMVLSALVAVAEFVLKVRVMPFSEGEAVFRPTGLTTHPLELGLWCAVAIGFVAAGDWPRGGKLAAGAILLAGCVVSGARLATLVGGACALVLMVAQAGAGLEPRRRQERRLLVALGAVLVGPVVLAGLVAAGALGRFGGGIADENASARIEVYGVLAFLPWRDILLGGDIDAVLKLVQEKYGLPFIESSLLVFVVQFGLFGAALLLGMMARLVRVILRGSRPSAAMAVVAFFAIALSNNGLSTKTSSVFLIIVLAVTMHPGGPPRRAPGPGAA